MQQLVEMGFSRSRAEYALKELADEEEPRAELVVAWLIDHPDIEVRVNDLVINNNQGDNGNALMSKEIWLNP